jgi:hypothetical protein
MPAIPYPYRTTQPRAYALTTRSCRVGAGLVQQIIRPRLFATEALCGLHARMGEELSDSPARSAAPVRRVWLRIRSRRTPARVSVNVLPCGPHHHHAPAADSHYFHRVDSRYALSTMRAAPHLAGLRQARCCGACTVLSALERRFPGKPGSRPHSVLLTAAWRAGAGDALGAPADAGPDAPGGRIAL